MNSWQCFNLFMAVTALFAGPGCQTHSPLEHRGEAEVRAVLAKQLKQWNAGDLSAFMETYVKSDDTRFAFGGEVARGWRTVYARYRKKYGDRSLMGTLRFSDLEVTMLNHDAALAFARWDLHRQAGNLSGLFTLLLRKGPEGWRIFHDHTSLAEEK